MPGNKEHIQRRGSVSVRGGPGAAPLPRERTRRGAAGPGPITAVARGDVWARGGYCFGTFNESMEATADKNEDGLDSYGRNRASPPPFPNTQSGYYLGPWGATTGHAPEAEGVVTYGGSRRQYG